MGHCPGKIQTELVYTGHGAGPVGESGLGTVIHTRDVGREDTPPIVRGEPLVNGDCPSTVLERFVNTVEEFKIDGGLSLEITVDDT